ncbi:MAG: hypothetical protein LBO81_01245, partial [Clostridiales Family XIII bacterium]|nr:hypothetical protein [Clostridiales Family XIII bacterium]
IFNTRSPYELEALPELEPLKMQYDLYQNMQSSTTSGIQKIDRIDAFWRTNTHTAATNRADADLNVLQGYYAVISREEDAKDQMTAVQSVMAAVDAARRAEVFTIVEGSLTSFIEDAERALEGGLTDSDLKSALNDSLTNVQTSLSEEEGKRLAVGVTVLSAARFDASNELIANAAANNYAACDGSTAKLVDLSSIESGQIKHQASEAGLLADALIPDATVRLIQALESGENAQYRSAVSAQSAGATLRAIVSDYRATLNAARGELESFITAYANRIIAEDSVAFINLRLEETKLWFDNIPGGAFSSEAQTCVNSHIEFLTALKRQLEIALGGSALDQMTQEKAALQDDYLAALDKNDLTGAQDIQKRMEALDTQIAAAENETNAQMSALEQEIADLQRRIDEAGGGENATALQHEADMLAAQLRALAATLSSSSVGNLAANLRSNALEIIANGGNIADLDNAIASLGEMMELNFKVVFPALKDVYDAMRKKHALEGSNAFAGQIETVESLITDNRSAYEASLAGEKDGDALGDLAGAYFDASDSGGAGSLGGGTGSPGDGTGSDLGAGGSGGLSGEGAIAYINALKEYADATGSGAARNLMRSEAQKQFALGNKFVYKKLDDPSAQYLPVSAVAAWRNMRYVWNRNLNKAVLTRGADYYAFTAWSDRVTRSRDEGKTDFMESMAGFLGCVYLPGSYTEKTFECEPVYLPDSDLGILMSEDIREMSDELLERFMQ